MRAAEEVARDLTWEAWRLRERGRLFPLGDLRLTVHPDWSRLDETFWGLAVGTVAPVGAEDPLDSGMCVVGVWRGIGRGFFGFADLRLAHLGHTGIYTHRPLANVGFIHVLPEAFQRIARRQFSEDER